MVSAIVVLLVVVVKCTMGAVPIMLTVGAVPIVLTVGVISRCWLAVRTGSGTGPEPTGFK